MILSLSEQAHLFVVSVFLGVKVIWFYDLFRALRKVKKFTNYQVHIQDLSFIFIITVYAFYVYLYESGGEIRVYYFIGLFLGGLVYYLLFSSFFISIMSKILVILNSSLIKAMKIVKLPIKLVYKITRPYIKKYLGRARRKVKNSKVYIVKHKGIVKRKVKGIKRMIGIIKEKV